MGFLAPRAQPTIVHAPKPAPAPVTPATAVADEQVKVDESKAKERERLRRQAKQSDTVLTSGLGVTDPAPVKKTTLGGGAAG